MTDAPRTAPHRRVRGALLSQFEHLLGFRWFSHRLYEFTCGDLTSKPLVEHREVYRTMQALYTVASCSRTTFAVICGERPRFTRAKLRFLRSAAVSGFVFKAALRLRGFDGRDKHFCCLIFLHICLGKLRAPRLVSLKPTTLSPEHIQLMFAYFFEESAALAIAQLFEPWVEVSSLVDGCAVAAQRLFICAKIGGPFQSVLLTINNRKDPDNKCSAKCLSSVQAGSEVIFYKWFARHAGNYILNWYISPYQLFPVNDDEKLVLTSTTVPIPHIGFFDPQWCKVSSLEDVSALMRIGRRAHQHESLLDFGFDAILRKYKDRPASPRYGGSTPTAAAAAAATVAQRLSPPQPQPSAASAVQSAQRVLQVFDTLFGDK